MLSFELKYIYIFGDCRVEDFQDDLREHELLAPRSISEHHFSSAASSYNRIDGSIIAYSSSLSDTEELDVKWCYQNGVPLVVWDKTGSGVPEWLRWHALAVFTQKERAVNILITSLGLLHDA